MAIDFSFPEGAVGNTYSDNPIEYVYFGLPLVDPRTPGVSRVSISEREQKVDVKSAAGTNGGRLTTHGLKPGSVEIAIQFWTQAQGDALQTLWANVWPDTAKKDLPCFDVSHPFLSFHNIKAIQVVGFKGPEPGPEPHSLVFTIKARVYQPAGKKTVTKSDEAPSSNNALTKGSHPTPSNTGPK